MSRAPLQAVTLAAIRDAAARLEGVVTRTPLVPLEVSGDGPELYLKLELLQPIGSFKVRGAGNAIALASGADRNALSGGVYTASAGNMAQGVAWHARRLGIPCSVIVPDSAPRTKLEATRRLGGVPVPVPFDEWWQVMVDHGHPEMPGTFVHPVSDPAVIAGNATIGLEILEDLPDVDAVVVPYGGGGLSCGIACALRELRPGVPVFAAEVDTAAPLRASLEAGSPQPIEYRPSFVDGIGSKGVLPEMWPLARSVLAGSLVVSVSQVENAVRLLATRARVVAEGAGATSVAAARTGGAGSGKVVCVVSGGNIDLEVLCRVLLGHGSEPLP